ncbi:unnamed protein product [Rangifer tarandus platyrhynchus]|uniref:Uncharacterized protein n=2 Tax=Rangifer tarandus platyrhynchus TaxID=3082113 RepID=A0ACB0FKN5_RANTA|nr:unnamed protein product [Rangifer tarandus platyrhynchus]CAI9712546.1 unnamed protein product [Rangifer tarandus platyrhynchus]
MVVGMERFQSWPHLGRKAHAATKANKAQISKEIKSHLKNEEGRVSGEQERAVQCSRGQQHQKHHRPQSPRSSGGSRSQRQRELYAESPSTEGVVSPGDRHRRVEAMRAHPHSLLSCCGFPRTDSSWSPEGKGSRRCRLHGKGLSMAETAEEGTVDPEERAEDVQYRHGGLEGTGASASVERSRRAHGLLAEARWPGQKPGCRGAPAAALGGPPAASGQLPCDGVMLGCAAGCPASRS